MTRCLLLCDEPTTALDVTVQRQVLDLILEAVQQRGTGLLFITHDLSVVANMCDRVLVMHNGQVVEEGSTRTSSPAPGTPIPGACWRASDLDATDADGRLFTVASAAAYVSPLLGETLPGETLLAGTGPGDAPAGGMPLASSAPAGRSDGAAAGEAPKPAGAGQSRYAAEPVISVQDLVRTYQRGRTSLFGKPTEVQALRGISFNVAAGQRFGVVGESGSGKSTLLRILAGLDQPSSGSVRVAGNEVAGAREGQLAQLRQQLQIVFQDPMGSLNPRMRVQDIIAEPLLAPGQKVDGGRQRKLVGEMLSAVGLPVDAADAFRTSSPAASVSASRLPAP